MNLIDNNPFRMLGIAANASEKEKAANLGKRKLLDIGKEVTFPLDLTPWLPSVARTSAAMDAANAAINLPQDKVRHALFWFVQPTDPMGKLAYDHLLQGNTNKALELFGRSNSWESNLCRSTLLLQTGRNGDAMLAFWEVSLKCVDLCRSICGQTFTMTDMELVKLYLDALTTEVDAPTLYAAWGEGYDVLPGGSEVIEFTLRDMAIEAPISTIEKAVAAAKSVSSKDASAQLAAGKRLMTDTKHSLSQLKQMSGDSRVSRLCDKLANQIFQCSVGYHNAIDNSAGLAVTATVIDECLRLARYAQNIAVGKLTRDRIAQGIATLEDKKSKLPPPGVEREVAAIMAALKLFISQPDEIKHSVTLLNTAKPHLQNMKATLGASNAFYLKLSTQVVANALHNLIEEVNESQKEDAPLMSDLFATSPALRQAMSKASDTSGLLRMFRIEAAVKAAWNCTKIIDTFDMEADFRSERYLPNKNTLGNMYSQLVPDPVPTPKAAPIYKPNYARPSSSSSYSSSSDTSSSGGSDTNWGCIIWGVIGFIIFIIIMANN